MYFRKGSGGLAALVASAAAASGQVGPSTLNAAAARSATGAPVATASATLVTARLRRQAREKRCDRRSRGRRQRPRRWCSFRPSAWRSARVGGGRGPCTPAADSQELCRSRRGYAWRDDGQDLCWWWGRRVMRIYGRWPRATPVSQLAASVEGGGRYRRQCLRL
jgi:hypothetical protein